MEKPASFITTFMVVPLLIALYAWTGHWVFEWTLGLLVVGFFLLMLMFSVLTWRALGRREFDDRVAAEASKIRAKGLQVLLHFLFGLAVAVAIFVYVNTFIAAVYCCTLALLQVMRLRIMRAAHM